MKLLHQKDINGCGIACLANLLEEDYDSIKKDFEKKFYLIERGIKITDMVRYLETKNIFYRSKFFNRNKKHQTDKKEAAQFTRMNGAITLIQKSKKYPIGHYLLRKNKGFIDPWINFPSIHNVYAGIRKSLPNEPWYVIYPINDLD